MSDRLTPELAAFCATQSPGLMSVDSVQQQSRRRRIDAQHGELARIGLGQCEQARRG